MPLPLAPFAGVALKYGAVALAGFALLRQVQPARIDQRCEDALDELPEGLTARAPQDRGQGNATARFRRVIRLGRAGPGIEVDASLLGRIRMRRV